jgi:hypothetical protein
MAMDEARFGLLGDPYRCWAPEGTRPVVGSRMIREYTYAYAAVSPHDGVMDSLILPFVNTGLLFLPPYSPEMSPPEHIWDHIRENYFGNRVFRNMNAVEDQLELALHKTELDPTMLKSLTGFEWITRISLIAN